MENRNHSMNSIELKEQSQKADPLQLNHYEQLLTDSLSNQFLSETRICFKHMKMKTILLQLI